MTLKLKSTITALFVPIAFTAILVSVSAFPMSRTPQTGKIVFSLFCVALAYITLQLVIKKDGSTFREYQLFWDKRTFKKFIVGSLAALPLASIMILATVWYSDLLVTSTIGQYQAFLLMSLTLIPLAFMEELIFRSFLLIKLSKIHNIWIVQFTIALLFALYHVVGAQGQSLLSAFMGPGIWSLIFGVLALQSKGIALPTGFHFGLNLILAAIGEKSWIPGILLIDFASEPTVAHLQAHEAFGFGLHGILLVIGILSTVYVNKRMNQPSKPRG